MHHVFFIYSSIYEHLGCSHILAIMLRWIWVYIYLFDILISISLFSICIYAHMYICIHRYINVYIQYAIYIAIHIHRRTGHIAVPFFFIIKAYLYYFLEWLEWFIFPPTVCRGFNFWTFSTLAVFNSSHSNRCR